MALKPEEVRVIRAIADKYKIPQDFALGITDMESAGRALWRVGNEYLPAIRIEGHYFWQRLQGKQREAAVKLGLASPKAGAIKNPSDMQGRYNKLKLMADINVEAAYQSISIGIGQIMGSHYKLFGYKSAVQMHQIACGGLAAQAEQMLFFISRNVVMYKAACSYNYAEFARLYNGPNYKKNRYDTELKKFVQRWPKTEGAVKIVDESSETASELNRIRDLGFDTVKEFQSAVGIKADGIIGPITRQSLIDAEAARKAKEAKPIKQAVLVGAGGAAAAGGALVAPNVADHVDAYVPVLNAVSTLASNGTYVAIGIGVVAVGVIIGLLIWNKVIKK